MNVVARSDGDNFWNGFWLQHRDTGEVISVQPAKAPCRDYRGAYIFRSRPEVALEPLQREGNTVRAFARRIIDSNRSAIEALYADATAGTHQCRVIPFQPRQDPLVAQAHVRVARLTEIQVSFGLPLQSLAEILRVSRPQLYKWLDASQLVRLQAESVARLGAIEQIAVKWSARSPAPLAPWLREPIRSERSLFDLMIEPRLDIDEIERAFDVVVHLMRNAPKSRAQRMREAGFARRPTSRSLPSDE